MARRVKPYIGSGKTIVNGARTEIEVVDGVYTYDMILDPIEISDIQAQVARHVLSFSELAQLGHVQALIRDLSAECEHARTLRLDVLVRGSRTKPDEWSAQILARAAGCVLERYGVRATIAEYETRDTLVQSLYLRLLPGLIRLAGFLPPKDIKGMCLRARRIEIYS